MDAQTLDQSECDCGARRSIGNRPRFGQLAITAIILTLFWWDYTTTDYYSTPLHYTTDTSTTTTTTPSAITSFPATASNVTTNIMDCITTDFRSHLYAQAFSVEVLRRSWILRWKLCVQNGSV